jgi:phosphoglycolate phosphatase-like HAD superfamily hydrolase
MNSVRGLVRRLMGLPPNEVQASEVVQALDAHLETDEREKQEFQEDLEELRDRIHSIEIQLGLVSRGEFDALSSISESGSSGVDDKLPPGIIAERCGGHAGPRGLCCD